MSPLGDSAFQISSKALAPSVPGARAFLFWGCFFKNSPKTEKRSPIRGKKGHFQLEAESLAASYVCEKVCEGTRRHMRMGQNHHSAWSRPQEFHGREGKAVLPSVNGKPVTLEIAFWLTNQVLLRPGVT